MKARECCVNVFFVSVSQPLDELATCPDIWKMFGIFFLTLVCLEGQPCGILSARWLLSCLLCLA